MSSEPIIRGEIKLIIDYPNKEAIDRLIKIFEDREIIYDRYFIESYSINELSHVEFIISSF